MQLYVNGEPIALAGGPTQRDVTEASWEVEGHSKAEFRVTEGDQKSPAGRYRMQASGDKLRLQRAASNTSNPWASATDLLTLDDEEAVFGVPLDVDSIKHFIGNIVAFLTPGQVKPIVEWLQGHGPTADPDGYLLLSVAEGKQGIVPYWDY